MAKLYFYYSAMNAGKTTKLLQSSFNYIERGMDTILYTSCVDNRFGEGKIASRIGLSSEANVFDNATDLYAQIEEKLTPTTGAVFVDEAQFLTKAQVQQICMVTDKLNIPVLAYGLRSNFLGEPFEGSMYLLVWADEMQEVKTICHCGRKATMNARFDSNNKIMRAGEVIDIGGGEKYTSLCRKHYLEGKLQK